MEIDSKYINKITSQLVDIASELGPNDKAMACIYASDIICKLTHLALAYQSGNVERINLVNKMEFSGTTKQPAPQEGNP